MKAWSVEQITQTTLIESLTDSTQQKRHWLLHHSSTYISAQYCFFLLPAFSQALISNKYSVSVAASREGNFQPSSAHLPSATAPCHRYTLWGANFVGSFQRLSDNLCTKDGGHQSQGSSTSPCLSSTSNDCPQPLCATQHCRRSGNDPGFSPP